MKLSRLTYFAFIAVALFQLLSVTNLQAQVEHNIIAASGEAAPAGGTYLNFLNTLALNARGQVTFDARLGGPSSTGVFVSDGSERPMIWLGRFADNSTAIVSSEFDK